MSRGQKKKNQKASDARWFCSTTSTDPQLRVTYGYLRIFRFRRKTNPDKKHEQITKKSRHPQFLLKDTGMTAFLLLLFRLQSFSESCTLLAACYSIFLFTFQFHLRMVLLNPPDNPRLRFECFHLLGLPIFLFFCSAPLLLLTSPMLWV